MILHDITLANTLDAAISNFRCNEGTVMHHSKRSLCVCFIYHFDIGSKMLLLVAI